MEDLTRFTPLFDAVGAWPMQVAGHVNLEFRNGLNRNGNQFYGWDLFDGIANVDRRLASLQVR